MSVGLERLKQQNEPGRQQAQHESSDSMMTVLTSILAVVEGQTTKVASLDTQVKKVAGFMKVMDEEQEKTLERMEQRLAQPSSDTDVVKMREQLDLLMTVQRQIAESLESEDVRRATAALTAATSDLRKMSSSVAERSAEQTEALDQQLVLLGAKVSNIASSINLERQAKVAARELITPLDRVDSLVNRVDRLGRWSWSMGGRLLAASLLLVITLLTINGVLTGVAELLGLAHVANAIWGAYDATDPWWGKTLWAVAGLSFAGSLGWLVWRGVTKAFEELR